MSGAPASGTPGRGAVLWIGEAAGDGECAAPDLLALAGFDVERAPSLVAGIGAVAGSRGAVVLLEDAALGTPDRADGAADGRAASRVAALRSSGAAAVIVVHPHGDAWRAERPPRGGADAAVSLPAPAGSLERLVATLAARQVRPRADAPAPIRPPADLPGGAIESIVGEVSTLHRNVRDPDRVLDLCLDGFARRSGAGRCSIFLFDRLRTELRLRRSTSVRDVDGAPPIPAGVGLVSHVAAAGEPALAPSGVSAGPDDAAEGGALLLPLRGSGDVLGVVVLAGRPAAEPFARQDIPPLAFYADQVGQAVETTLELARLQQLAAVDELTGLANRRQFQASLEREVQRARRYDRPLSLAILDVDHFKKFNDLCGHQAGDRALATVGEILRTSLREVDVVARYGGEEFAVILPETAPDATAGRSPFPFLERLRKRIEQSAVPGSEKLPLGRLTISGGVASFPGDAKTPDDLVREADRALYVSKSRGRNTITWRDGPVGA